MNLDSREINKAIERARHTMPTPEEVAAEMGSEAKLLTTIDLQSAFNQLELEESSRYITAFTTHRGNFVFKRLHFGINSASEIFQKTLEEALSGLEGVRVYVDDILVFGDEKNHRARVFALLDRLDSLGLTASLDKFEFEKREVVFVGWRFSKAGVAPGDDKVEALKKAERPQTASEVRSLLGLGQYCERFIKDYAERVKPLRELTKQKSRWCWGTAEEEAFEYLRTAIMKEEMAFYNTKWQTEITVDASPVGLSAVLAQRDPKDSSVASLVAFASRLLSDVEGRYSQFERETLAAVWGCEKFRMYLIGCRFSLFTDNKKLEMLLWNTSTKLPARVARWILRLSSFKFDVVHKPGEVNEADYMSRHPVGTADVLSELIEEGEDHICLMRQVATPSQVATQEL